MIIESKPFCLEVPYKTDINPKGRCCCNCQWQRPISSHPWNTNELTKGSISVTIGYGCTYPEMDRITFMEKEHSLCEVHDWRKEK